MRTMAALTTIAALAACSGERSGGTRELSLEEAREIKGGLSVDITYPAANNASQGYDNLKFTADVQSNFTTQPTYVSLWADNSKIAGFTMQFAGDETQTIDTRSRWPLGGNHDARFKLYYDGQYYEADGDSLRTDQRIASDVRVHGIRFWNVHHKGASPSLSSSFVTERVDASNVDRAKTAANIDGIFGQCAQNGRVQFRGTGVTTAVPGYDPGAGYSCADLQPLVAHFCPVDDEGNSEVCPEEGSPSYGGCPQIAGCLQALGTIADGWDASVGYTSAHVFHVVSTPCGELGRTFTYTSAGSGTRTLQMVAVSAGGDAQLYTKTLAHELMHEAKYGHCNQDDHGPIGCEEIDCTANPATEENLMCSSGLGRDLTTAQCDLAKGFRWTDLN